MIEDFLAPAILVALAGVIVQGMAAALDLYDRLKAREMANRQRAIALCVALMGLGDALPRSEGEVLEIKRKLVGSLVSETLPNDLVEVLGLVEHD